MASSKSVQEFEEGSSYWLHETAIDQTFSLEDSSRSKFNSTSTADPKIKQTNRKFFMKVSTYSLKKSHEHCKTNCDPRASKAT